MLFLVVGSIFGLITILAVPVLTVPDEGVHFWVSYGTFSSNQKIPEDLLVAPEEPVREINRSLYTYIDSTFQKKADLHGDSFRANLKSEIVFDNPGTLMPKKPLSVSYLDMAHLPQAIGVLIGKLIYPSLGVMVLVGRIANLLLYLGAIYLIIKKVRYGKLAFVCIALFPMMIQQAASLSYDVFNAITIFAWMALMINLFAQKTSIKRRQIIVLIVLMIALFASKQSNLLLLLFLPMLPVGLYKDTRPFVALRNVFTARPNKKIIKIVATSVVSIITLLLLFLVYKYMHSRDIGVLGLLGVLFNTFLRPELNTQLDPMLTTGLVGNFGWLWYRLPEWLVIIQLMVLVLILLGEKAPNASKRLAVTSGSLLILSAIGITLGLYFKWTLLPFVGGSDAKFVQGIQGRYFTPLLVLLIPLFAYLRKYISVVVSRNLLVKLCLAMSVFSLIIYTILTYVFFYTPADGVKNILL